MVGMSMRVDDEIELEPMVRQHAEIALDAVLDRIDYHRALHAFGSEQVGFALGVVQFAKDHVALLTGTCAVISKQSDCRPGAPRRLRPPETIAPRALKCERLSSNERADGGLTGGERGPMMPAVELRLAVPLAIFAFTYFVFAVGNFPGLKLDRTGAALAGGGGVGGGGGV